MKKEPQKRILVIEDESDLRRVILYKLTKEGFDVLEAESGENALKTLKKTKKVDLIWLDLLMPGMGGLKFLETIRQNDLYKNIPVIIVSVSGRLETIKKASEHNILGYMMKGQSDLSQILKKIKQYFK